MSTDKRTHKHTLMSMYSIMKTPIDADSHTEEHINTQLRIITHLSVSKFCKM